MALVYTHPTQATRAGARDLNRAHRTFAQEDLGAKLEQLITVVNGLLAAATSAAASGVSFSAFSAAPATIAQFRA